MRITVIPNRKRPETAALLEAVYACLQGSGADLKTAQEPDGLPGSALLTEALAGCDAAIAIGGDGTIMHVAKAAAAAGCPVLGLNGGHLGFLAGVERDELDSLSALLDGTYTLDDRALLQVTVHTAAGAHSYLAMNEAVISRGSLSRLVDVCVCADGDEIMRCRGDGIIVATPTGSTAYSLSAGGPVVDPAVDCVLLTPVCPHSLDSRSRLLPTRVALTVRAAAADGETAFITVDGEENIPLTADDYVTIERAATTARLIRLKSASFYDRLCHKLSDRR